MYSDPAATEHLPLKRKLAREHFEPTIQRAVELLGRNTGRVRSLIIPGLEPLEGTLRAGVEWLAAMGCHPDLSPFRPARNTRYAAVPPVRADDVSYLLTDRRIVSRHGVALGPPGVSSASTTR